MPLVRDDEPTLPPEGVRVLVGEGERRRVPLFAYLAIVILAVLLASAGVLFLVASQKPEPGVPPTELDAKAPPAVPGATRLAFVGPLMLLDSRTGAPLAAGASVPLPVPVLPTGSTAVLVEVSVVAATAPGEVAIGSGSGDVTVLQVPRAGAQTSATAVVPLGASGALTVRTTGGGHVLVNLVGAFEPAATSTAGRVVPMPATRVVRLVPDNDGKNAAFDLASVPELAAAPSVSAVLLQIAADVGPRGGFVVADGAPERPDQTVFWSATSGTDRTRAGFLVVPVTGPTVALHYEAGSLLTADVVGYVTGASAPESVTGLVVPVPPGAVPAAARIEAGQYVDVPLVAGDKLPSAEQVAAALVRVGAVGDTVGGVSLYAPDASAPADPNLVAAAGPARATVALVRTVGGKVRVGGAAGTQATLALQAVVLA